MIGSFATVGGTKPNLKITPKKTGNFTAKIVLEHPTFLDLNITDATFEILSDSTEITSWKFAGQAATINGTHITVQYPFGTPVNALKATVEISKGASIKPDPEINTDYTNPVNFTVTAEDENTTQKYTLTVTFGDPNISCTGGWRDKNAYTARIDHKAGKITLEVNSADFELDFKLDGATITPDPNTIRDWTSEVSFTIQKGSSKKTYGMRVTVDGKNIIKVNNANIESTMKAEITKHGNTANYNYVDVSGVTDMTGSFAGSYDGMIARYNYFNGDITKWDTSKVTKTQRMFQYCVSFDQPIGNWDVSKVNNMRQMFNHAKMFNQPLGNWNVSSALNMKEMFNGANRFNQPIGNWTVSSVGDMQGMFIGASNFNQPIGNWDVSNVTDMSRMFGSAEAFNQPIGNWTVSEVKNMESMFRKASKFNQPIGNWTVSEVKSMKNMFNDAIRFNQPIGNWTVSSVTNMDYMFNSAIRFNQNIKGWDVDQVTKCTNFSKGATVFDAANKPTGFTCKE